MAKSPAQIADCVELRISFGEASVDVRGSEEFAQMAVGKFYDQLRLPQAVAGKAVSYTEAEPSADVERAINLVEPEPAPPAVQIDDSREWGESEDKKLFTWRLADQSFERIGEALKRSEDAVGKRYRLLEQRAREADGRG